MARKSKTADKEYNHKYYLEHKKETHHARVRSARKWATDHKLEWATYMREYRKRKKEEKAKWVDKDRPDGV